MGNERSSEGVTGGAGSPDPDSARKPRAEDLHPQAFDLFMDELREAFGLKEYEAGGITEVVDKVTTRHADTWGGSLFYGLMRAVFSYSPQQDVPQDLEKRIRVATAKVENMHAELKRHREDVALIPMPALARARPDPAQHPEEGSKVTGLNGGENAIGGFLQELLSKSDLDAPAAFELLGVCMELAIFLMDKNRKYGDSALDPVRIMSQADPVEQIKVRMDDKLSRLYRGQAGGEDAMADLVGYWVLLRVAEKRRAAPKPPLL